MSDNEALAAAAHLHVLLRRKTGRVTDTEWLATNAEYAHVIVRFAKERARHEGHADLLSLAERLESLVLPSRRVAAARPATIEEARPAEMVDLRYVGRLR
jgi:hypothetical protein